jgi:hypothetical protein
VSTIANKLLKLKQRKLNVWFLRDVPDFEKLRKIEAGGDFNLEN